MMIKSSGQDDFAIITFGNLTTAGESISAERIFADLILERCWYITKFTKAQRVGSHVLLYQNGTGFRASSTVAEIRAESRTQLFQVPILLGFTHRLALTDITVFPKAVALGPLVQQMTFITNKAYWGTALRSSPRSIPRSDFVAIVDRGRKGT
jgi:hypothetical protein